MAAANEQDDVTLLRAIAHARMYVTSGRGLESVVFTLVHQGLGSVSKSLAPALDRMDEGEMAEAAVRTVLDGVEDPHMRAFLSALIASGKPGIMRLDELSTALHTEREARAEVYSSRLTGILDMTAAIFVFAFAPTIIRVLGRVPDNPILPAVKMGPLFEPIFYTILAGILTIMLAMARSK
ncbi:MAG: hypothetical protein H6733_12830 [Alphaproteobacteria bacterium]|nr:hypothetical protein [Alphaproteobacteria bacterium]